MNEIDNKIIKILRKNSRTSYTQIAGRLNLPEASARYRVKSLIKKGIIKRFTLELATSGTSSLVGAKTNPNIDSRKVSKTLLKIQGVEKIFELTGEFDLMILIRTSDPPRLNAVLETIRATQGVAFTTAFFILQEHGV